MVLASLWLLGGGPMAVQASAPAPGVPLSGVVTGAQLVDVLARGVPVDANGLQVTGEVNLTSLTNITAALRCSGCLLRGALRADDVEFHGVVDLSGSTIVGGVQARGARFDRGMVLTRGRFEGPVSLDQAVFEEQAALGAAVFDDVASFAGARFQGESIFAGARFARPADFSGAVFAGDADFSGQALPGAAGPHHCPDSARRGPGAAVSFAGTIFRGRADFYNRCFTAGANFFGTVFAGAANFDSAEFMGDAVFENASFGSDATFVLTWFDATADFTSVLAAGGLSFDLDTFGGSVELNGAVVSGRLSLMNLTRAPYCKLPGRRIAVGCLYMDNLTAGGIVMDPEKVGALVLGPVAPLRVLTEIEQTARADGDITTANDARYDRLTLAARARSGSLWASVQDGFFYRTVAGYLVRPRQPLISLGVLVAAGFLLRCLLRPPIPARLRERIKHLARALRRATAPTGEAGLAPEPPAQAPAPAGSGNPGHGQPSRGEQAAASPCPPQAEGRTASEEKAEPAGTAARPSWLVRPFEALRDTVVAALKPLPSKEAREAARRPQRASDVARALAYTAEYLSYKVLTLLFLTCIANSNETLHQFIDAAFGIK